MSKDEVTEHELAQAAVAPRVTPEDVEAEIASDHYFTAGDGVIGAFVHAEAARGRSVPRDDIPGLLPSLHLLTFCVLTLKNGFTVTGESACASPENFNAEIGRRLARAAAVQKIWPLLGFRLRDRLTAEER